MAEGEKAVCGVPVGASEGLVGTWAELVDASLRDREKNGEAVRIRD